MIRETEVRSGGFLAKLVLCIALPLAVGILSSFLTGGAMMDYGTMAKPPLSPPTIVFPIAWSILYVLMGLAAYCVYISDAPAKDKRDALMCYYGQLFLNFMWSFFFFNFKEYLFAFAWLMLLWFVVLLMLLAYRKISWTAFYLTVPYLAWLTFAAYLNLGVYILNR